MVARRSEQDVRLESLAQNSVAIANETLMQVIWHVAGTGSSAEANRSAELSGENEKLRLELERTTKILEVETFSTLSST